MHYTKPALTFDEQMNLLRQRGLAILDADRAIRWLQKVSYYRLSAYCLPFKDGEVVCQVLADGCFDGLDLVVIDVDDPLALEWAPRAVEAGARVVDKSAGSVTIAGLLENEPSATLGPMRPFALTPVLSTKRTTFTEPPPVQVIVCCDPGAQSSPPTGEVSAKTCGG